MTKEDLRLSPVIMGTWQAGKQYWTGIEDKQIIRAIEAAFEAGITTFDTAEEYGDGYSEQILGKALGAKRPQTIICSKVFSNHLREKAVIEACHRSLKNLGTDYLDIYQIHWPSGCWGTEQVPMTETMAALRKLKEQGKIRAIGVSNFDLQQLKEAASCDDIFTIQPPYSLFWRHIDQEIRPYCQAEGIRILAYSPLGQGILTGRFSLGHQFDEGDNRRHNILFQQPHANRVQAALAALRPIAEKQDISLAQLAIAWVLNQSQTHAIVGARNAAQIIETAAASEVHLSREDLSLIEQIGRPVSEPLMEQTVLWDFST